MYKSIKEKMKNDVLAKMIDKFGYKNGMQVPTIKKVVINVGIGKFLKDQNAIDEIRNSLETISGQKMVMTQARQSIAGFKIREGLAVGMKATLRGSIMWDFLEKLVNVAIPRIRDFRGIKLSSIDNGGNMNIGIKEHLVFPEIVPEKIKNLTSFQVNITTNSKSREESLELFKLLGFPMEK